MREERNTVLRLPFIVVFHFALVAPPLAGSTEGRRTNLVAAEGCSKTLREYSVVHNSAVASNECCRLIHLFILVPVASRRIRRRIPEETGVLRE